MTVKCIEDWIHEHFPDAEIRTFSTLIVGTIESAHEYNSFNRDPEEKKILRFRKMVGFEVCSDQDVFFESEPDGTVFSCNKILKQNDVVLNKNNLFCATMFNSKDGDSVCYAGEGSVILRAKSAEIARFIVWYLSLDFVNDSLQEYLKDKDMWEIEMFPVPYAKYLEDKTFVNALRDISEAENRITRNANEMLDRLREIREDILSELGS